MDVIIIHINLPLQSLYLLKKPHQNPLRSFKDLSKHRDRESDFVLYYVVIITRVIFLPLPCILYHVKQFKYLGHILSGN